MENYSKKIITKLKILGYYQIAGGIIGLLLTVYLISTLTSIPILLLLILLLPLGLYSYSIYCGILLLKQNLSGLKHSLINQILQVVTFSISGFTFQYISGVYLMVGLDLTKSLTVTFNLGVSSWNLIIDGDPSLFIISVNCVAIFLISFITKLKKSIHAENFARQITSIGE